MTSLPRSLKKQPIHRIPATSQDKHHDGQQPKHKRQCLHIERVGGMSDKKCHRHGEENRNHREPGQKANGDEQPATKLGNSHQYQSGLPIQANDGLGHGKHLVESEDFSQTILHEKPAVNEPKQQGGEVWMEGLPTEDFIFHVESI